MNAPSNPLHMWKYAGEMASKAVRCKAKELATVWFRGLLTASLHSTAQHYLSLWDAFAIIVEKVLGRRGGGGEEVTISCARGK